MLKVCMVGESMMQYDQTHRNPHMNGMNASPRVTALRSASSRQDGISFLQLCFALFLKWGTWVLRMLILIAVSIGAWGGVAVTHTEVRGNGELVSQIGVGFGEEARADVRPSEADPASQALRNAPADTSISGLSTINAILNMMYIILTPFMMLAGWLLTPDWVFGEIFGLRTVLHDLWVLLSNIVYVIFAFLLVAMAFMNIFSGEKNTWAIKAKLPKLIIGVISVPFTWFFVSGVLSVTSVLTASVVQFAGDLKPTGPEFIIPTYQNCTMDFTASASGTPAAGTATGSTGKDFFNCTDKKDRKLSELLKSDSAFGMVSYYAYGVFGIQDYKTITNTNLPTLKSVLDLSMQLIVSLIMFVVFFLIIVALVFALFMRALYFWAIAVASPLLSLRYFFEWKLGGFGDKWLSIEHILWLAMVPVYVAAALSFGLIFCSAVSNTHLGSSIQDSTYVKYLWPAGDNGQKMTIFGTTYTVKGVPTGMRQVWGDITTFSGGYLGRLIVSIIALGVLWFAVMAALKGSEVTKEAVQPIADFGGEIGKLLKKLPQYAPVIPTGHGAASIASLPQISAQITQGINSKYGQGKGTDIGKSIAEAMGLSSPMGDKLNKANKYLVDFAEVPKHSKPATELLPNLAARSGLTTSEISTPEGKKILVQAMDKITGLSAEQKKELTDLIGKLDGTPGTMHAFLKKYNEIAGLQNNEFDEAHEWDAKAKEGAAANKAATNATPAADRVKQIIVKVDPLDTKTDSKKLVVPTADGTSTKDLPIPEADTTTNKRYFTDQAAYDKLVDDVRETLGIAKADSTNIEAIRKQLKTANIEMKPAAAPVAGTAPTAPTTPANPAAPGNPPNHPTA